MSIVIDREPEATYEELGSITNPTTEIQEALAKLDKGKYFVVTDDEMAPRGLSRRIHIAVKRLKEKPAYAKADFDTKRVGTSEWAVMRRN